MPLPQKLLLILVQSPNQTLSSDEISRQLWPSRRGANQAKNPSGNLSLVVHRLRHVFSAGPLGREVIRAVYGKGYRLDAAVESCSGAQLFADRSEPGRPGSPPQLPHRAEDPIRAEHCTRAEDRHLLSGMFYAEAHDLWPDRDPSSLSRQLRLMQQSIDHDPGFSQAYLELCYLQLLQCLWGVRSSASTLPELQGWLRLGDALPSPSPGWAAIKAEAMSLLFWQPQTSHRLYANWLASNLPAGLPRFSWARHLIFTGRPRLALQLLQSQAHPHLSQGLLVTSLAYAALGEIPAAQQAAEQQLRLNSTSVGSRLFLAMLSALRGDSEAAIAWIEACGVIEKPFQGSLALAAYALAQGRLRPRAQHLLDEALALIPTAPDRAGALGYWGLAALALERSTDAISLLKLSVRRHCYSAPVLLATPFLTPYAPTPAVQLFRERMGRAFVATP
jgi:DNA-binding winged helix-turn-helix (wHTH) protein/tetratricopeptide (TPR) repeat protein